MNLAIATFRRDVWTRVRGLGPSVAYDVEWLQQVEDEFPSSMRNVPEVLGTTGTPWRTSTDEATYRAEVARLTAAARLGRHELTPHDFAHGAIRLDIGAGPAPAYGYVHVDAQPGPDIEIVAAVWDIPLQDGSCAEIRASHLLEHLPFAAHDPVGGELRRLLRPGGVVDLQTPNLSEVCQAFVDADTAAAQMNLMTPEIFGSQVQQFEFHLSGWTRETMRAWLERHDFVDIDIHPGPGDVRATARKRRKRR